MAYKDLKDPRNRAAKRRHYYKNKDQYARRSIAWKASFRRFLNAIKSYPCTDCGKSYPPWVMDLDHRPGEDKLYEIARLITLGSLRKAITEIMKCDLVCSNCHRERTHQRNEEGS